MRYKLREQYKSKKIVRAQKVKQTQPKDKSVPASFFFGNDFN